MKVTYIDSMGSDLSVVNAARVSFGKESDWDYSSCPDPTRMPIEIIKEYARLFPADRSLIQFLARGCTSGDWEQLLCDMGGSGGDIFEDYAKHIKNMPTHWTPFGHTAITLHIKAPIFVARQLGKHQTGLVWNEVSRRYVTDEPEFYVPEVWRKRANNVKQGSSDEQVATWATGTSVPINNSNCLEIYKVLLQQGVCPEQARMVLPQSMYTEWYWTGNLYAFANVFIQRTDSHAQKEVQEVAKQIGEIIKPLFPVSWEALTQ